MIHDDQSSSSRMLSRAETDAINSILDEEEIRIGQFSSLSPNISALDEQCKQIWSNWESIPASAAKAYSNNNYINNSNNNSSPRIAPQTKPSNQFDIYDSIPKRTEKYKLSTPTSNKISDFNNSIDLNRFNDKPKSSRYDEVFSRQEYSSPSTQPRTKFGSTFETTARPPPTIDDIADFSTKPTTFSQRSPSYRDTRSINNIDPLKNFATPFDTNTIRRNQTEFDYQIPSQAAIKTGLIENDVGNLKNELNTLMAKVRTASRSPTSVNLNNSPTHSDPFSVSSKERSYARQQTATQNFKDFSSPSYQTTKTNAFNQQERFSSPIENKFTSSSSPKLSSKRHEQKSYDIGMNDDSFIQRNSLSINDDININNNINNNDDDLAEPINITRKISSEPKLSTPFVHEAANQNLNINQPTNSQPEILLLRQENVRLKAELLKVQKQLQAEHEEKENIKLSLVKCEQLRQRYKERLKMYEKQMGVQQQQQPQ